MRCYHGKVIDPTSGCGSWRAVGPYGGMIAENAAQG